MAVTKRNIVIDQGADFSANIVVRSSNGSVMDLTGYTGASEARVNYRAANAAMTFTVTIPDANNGVVNLSLDKSLSKDVEPKRYLFDVELTDASNNTIRGIEGIATVTPNFTR